MNSLSRYFDMLSLIPKAPNSITTPEIWHQLQRMGYKVELRTVQRDLDKISLVLPITSTENNKPIRWFWADNVKHTQFPLMSTDEALTFKLAEMFLEPLLPPSVRSRLSGYFEQADRRLQESEFSHWAEKVGVIHNNLSLSQAKIESSVLAVVYEALLKNKRVKATYQSLHHPEKVYEISPLGLVFRDNVIYLVATFFEHTDIKQLALHRFKNAELLNQVVTVPEGFVLKKYIAQGHFSYPVNNMLGEIALKLKVGLFLKQILLETPLSSTQHIEKIDQEHYLVKAVVNNTEQLHWWLRSFGTLVEVLEPADLRAKFAAEISKLSKMYQ